MLLASMVINQERAVGSSKSPINSCDESVVTNADEFTNDSNYIISEERQSRCWFKGYG